MIDVVPSEFVGVWQRESLQINGAPPFEDSRVIWLQTPSRYGDIRVSQPNGNAISEAFGGSQEWHAPALTFHRSLDLGVRLTKDIGSMSWDGETLIEEGCAVYKGLNVDFRERWTRCTGLAPDYQALEAHDDSDSLVAIALQIDDHAVFITDQADFSASYLKFIHSRWTRQWAVGRELVYGLPNLQPGERQCIDSLNWYRVD